MGPSAETIFGLACIGKKVCLLVEVFHLFEHFILKRLLFLIGSESCRKLTKSNVGVPPFVWVLVQKQFLV